MTKFCVGDSVVVIAGKDKGLTGQIRKLSQQKSLVWVDGVNKKQRNFKRRGEAGQKVDFFAPLAISNVAFLDPKNKKPSRIGFRFMPDGQKVRISKSSGQTIERTSLETKPAPQS